MVAPLVPVQDAKLNKVADALLNLLESATVENNAARYIGSNATAKRGSWFSDLTMEQRPAIVLTVVAWTNEPLMGGMPGRHRSEATFRARLVLDEMEGAEQASIRMMRDKVVACVNAENLPSGGVDLVTFMEARNAQFTPPDQAGRVIVDLEIAAGYEWDHSTGP